MLLASRILAAIAVIGLIPLCVTAALSLNAGLMRRLVPTLTSFAAGALLGTAVFHLIPEGLARHADRAAVGLAAFGGFAGFMVLDHLLHARATEGSRPLVTLNVVGDGLHNFVDGAIVAAAWMANGRVGALATLAIAIHEIPREVSTFGILVASGMPARRAIALNVATGFAAVLGAAGVLAIGGLMAPVVAILLPAGGGAFVYLAAAVLIPQLRREAHGAAAYAQTALIAAGAAVSAASAFLH